MTSRAAAARYARALFDVAFAERQDLEQIDRELAGIVTLVQSNEALQRALFNPAIPASRKRGVVEQLLSLSPVNPILCAGCCCCSPTAIVSRAFRISPRVSLAIDGSPADCACQGHDRRGAAGGSGGCARARGWRRRPAGGWTSRSTSIPRSGRRGRADRQHRLRRQHHDTARETEAAAGGIGNRGGLTAPAPKLFKTHEYQG